MTPETLNAMRLALRDIRPGQRPATARFVQSICGMPIEAVTEPQRRHIIRLCWRYRAQIPRRLWPSKDAVEAMDSCWRAVTVAGVEVMTSTWGERKLPLTDPQCSLFEVRR